MGRMHVDLSRGVKFLQKVTLIRRFNLGSYEFYELVIEIEDESEARAWERAKKIYLEAAETLDLRDKIVIKKVGCPGR